MKDIYACIKEQMQSKGMTALALAEVSGVGKSTIYRIIDKNRKNAPTVDSLQKILSALGWEIKLSPVTASTTRPEGEEGRDG